MFTRTLFNCTITYSFSDAGIHLISDPELHRLMKNYPEKGVRELAEALKTHFGEVKKRPLNISTKSLVTEIRGHYYFEKLYPPFRRLLQVIFLQKLANLVDKSLKAYDCAEAGKDGNRKIWDFLSHFDRVFSWFLRDS
ncbi:hypothetical protein [Leadbetterella sp. DM7]|uniref:hypothetical protein n=1 Tax=Leadbetterella sp. DM7 TaxID=3235085 RepID=UPI00349E8870